MIMSFRVYFDIIAWRRKQSVSPGLDGPDGAPARGPGLHASVNAERLCPVLGLS